MALSNDRGALVLTTGNKSEMSVGYATLYGDMAGGLAVIKDVPKQLVYELVEHRNARAGRELVPASVLERAPSAELRADQLDEDSLPPYELLDRVLEGYVERDLSREELVAEGLPAERRRRGDQAGRPRRVQAPPGAARDPRSRARPSAATGGCRSPTGSAADVVAETMRAVRLAAPGGHEQLVNERIATPVPGPGEALVRVEAAAITRGELEWPLDRLPAIPSYELCGVVAALADDVAGVSVGDRVYALTGFDRDGVAADYAVVPASLLAPKPEATDAIESASIPLPGLSAWQGLFEHGGLEAGERVLIHGAAGNVGQFATQLARQRGAQVIGTTSAGSVERARALGADQVVDRAARQLHRRRRARRPRLRHRRRRAARALAGCVAAPAGGWSRSSRSRPRPPPSGSCSASTSWSSRAARN